MTIRTSSWAAVLATLFAGCLAHEPDHPDPPKPVVTGVTPAEAAAGDLVRIAGTDFGAARGRLTIGMLDATPGVTAWSDLEIEVTVPDLTEGEVTVVVEQQGIASDPFPMTIVSAALPAIREIRPPSAAAGTEVEILGARFGATQAAGSEVRFSSAVTATIVSWSDVSIHAVVPDGAVSGGVVVVTPGGESLPFDFVVDSFGAITTDILVPRCALPSCHDDTTRRAQLSLTRAGAYAGLVGVPAFELPSQMRVVAGAPDDSYLWVKLTQVAPAVGERMPLDRPALTAPALARIRAWIVSGAPNN